MKSFVLSVTMILNTVIGMAQTNGVIYPDSNSYEYDEISAPEGTYRLTCDGYEVYTIASADKAFQPASLYYGKNEADKAKVDSMAPDGKVPTAMNCFVVRTPGGYVMFDTGLPESKGGKTLDRLKSLNISPSDIKALFVTHSHFDHIGGLLDESGNAVYTDCRLYVPAKEYAYMQQSMAETVRSIESAYKDRIMIFEPGEILPYNVLPISAIGHTPGHTAYRLGQLLFVGDILHGASIQLPDPSICANFDADRAQSIATRRLILAYARTNSLTALGAHIPLSGIIF